MNTYFAIDIGGTSVKYGLIDETGHIGARGHFPTGERETREDFLDKLTRACDACMDENVRGIGVSSLGFVNAATGRFDGGTENLPFLTELALPAWLRTRYARPVCFLNDASAAAIGEMAFGAARDTRNFLCMTIGTGIGGAIVLNGQLIEGAHFRAGEFGYWNYTDPAHYLEREVSTPNMLKIARAALGGAPMDGVAFFARIRAGDNVCLKILTDQMTQLAEMIANLILVLDVEKIVIGGGVSGAKDILIPVLENEVARRVPRAFHRQYAIVAAQCGNDAGMLGAVWRFLEAEPSFRK